MLLDEAKRLSSIGNILSLIGNAIVVSTDDQEAILQGAIIQLVGTLATIKAILITVELNSVVEKPIPESLNQLKWIGAVLTLIGVVISTKVLYDETNLKTTVPAVAPTSISI